MNKHYIYRLADQYKLSAERSKFEETTKTRETGPNVVEDESCHLGQIFHSTLIRISRHDEIYEGNVRAMNRYLHGSPLSNGNSATVESDFSLPQLLSPLQSAEDADTRDEAPKLRLV